MLKYSSLILLCASMAASAQQVVATSGDSYQKNNAQVSWTLGELSTETQRAFKVIATQGMQQPTLSVVTDVNVQTFLAQASVYPNPTSLGIQLTILEQSLEHLAYSVCDLQGKEFLAGKVASATSDLDFSTLPQATYVLKISKNGTIQKTFKIIKQ